MKPSKRMLAYADLHFKEVMHTTLNPEGPGVVRIHLIPPAYTSEEMEASVAIINGQDIIPVNTTWTIVLCELISQINKFHSREVSDADVEEIVKETCKGVRKVFPLLPKKWIRSDIYTMMNTFKQIAYREETDEEIEYISLGDYAQYMRAPHRMDLMVSAMTKEGKWHCNQKCIHCYAAGQIQAEEEELNTDDWKKIIDRCRKAGIPQLTFTGGEPTMREDLVELIDYSRWFVTRLNTNGIRLTEDFCRDLYGASLDSMQITFYSDDPEVHNQLVGANQYENTVSGIRHALAAGLNVSINTPLCTANQDYVKTLKFLHELGVTYVTCSGLITTGNAIKEASQELQLTTEQIEEVLRKATAYCFANGMEISFTSPGWLKEEVFEELGIMTPSCGACLSNMAITPGGNVVPCQSWLSGDLLGSMLTEDWESIWNKDICKKRRDYSAQMMGICPLRRGSHEN